MNTAIFGGTFDPVHNGHIRLLRTVLQAVEVENAFIIPDRIPPHKQAPGLSSGQDRLEMLRLAAAGLDRVTVSDWELEREGKSYSYYTVKHFRELYPEGELYFIMGSDMLLSFDKWYKAEELMKLCTPLCITRSAADTDACREKARQYPSAVFVEAEPFEVSSTQIRRLAAEGRYDELEPLVDPKVLGYIIEKKLYISKD